MMSFLNITPLQEEIKPDVTVTPIIFSLILTFIVLLTLKLRRRNLTNPICMVDDREPMNNYQAWELRGSYNMPYTIHFMFVYDLSTRIKIHILVPTQINDIVLYIHKLHKHVDRLHKLLEINYSKAETLSNLLARTLPIGNAQIQVQIDQIDDRISNINRDFIRELSLLRKLESVYLFFDPFYTRIPMFPGEES